MATEVETLPLVNFDFAKRLKFARLYLADVRYAKQFAERVGFSHQSYQNWENGQKPHDIVAVAQKIEDAFPGRISAQWLLFGGELQLRMKVTDCAA